MSDMILSCPFTLSPNSTRILWEVTGKCNLNCRHCLYFGGGRPIAPDLRFDQLIAILDDVARGGQVRAIWLSGGEPLLREDLVSLAQAITDRGLVPSVSTNGTLLTDILARNLFQAGVRYIHLSVDGVNAEIHDRLRNTRGAFRAVMQGIDHLKHNGIRCGASYMVTRDSVTQVPEMIALAREKGLDVLSFYLIAPIGRGTAMNDANELSLMEALDAAVAPYLALPDLTVEVFRTVSSQQRADITSGLMPCRGQHFYTITNDGRLAACPWLAKSETCFAPVSLLETEFRTARVEVNRRMAQLQRERTESLSGDCAKCARRERCGLGCPAVSEKNGADPLCAYLR